MPVSNEYLEFVKDQLESLESLRIKKMFGAVGIYSEGVMFSLIADDVLYFRVDDVNRGEYEKAGMKPFKPWEDKPNIMPYYEIPIDILESRETISSWAERAIEAAIRCKKK